MDREALALALYAKWSIEGSGFPERDWVEPDWDDYKAGRDLNPVWRQNMKGKVSITKKLVEAVKKDACFSCGKHSYEACPRSTYAMCGREHQGGSRKPTKQTIVCNVR